MRPTILAGNPPEKPDSADEVDPRGNSQEQSLSARGPSCAEPPPIEGSYRDVLNRINDRLDDCRTAMDAAENRATAAKSLGFEATARSGSDENETCG